MPDELIIGYVDIEKNEGMRTRFGIRSVPVIYLMIDGQFYQYPSRKMSNEDLEQLTNFALRDYKELASNNG